MQRMKTLTPFLCPFCGHNVKIRRVVWKLYKVEHVERIRFCAMEHGLIMWAEDDADAVDKWNERDSY